MCCSKLNSAELNLLFSLKISCYSCKKKKRVMLNRIFPLPQKTLSLFLLVIMLSCCIISQCWKLVSPVSTSSGQSTQRGGVLCIHLDALVSVYRGFRLCSHGNREVSYSVPWLRRCVSLCLSVCLTNYPSKRE